VGYVASAHVGAALIPPLSLFHFWNLELSSTEKVGIQPTYHEPFQEVVTFPLPAPLGAEQTWFYSTAASTHVGSSRVPLRSRRTVSPPKATSHRLHLTGGTTLLWFPTRYDSAFTYGRAPWTEV
jgi:hypothetical protein